MGEVIVVYKVGTAAVGLVDQRQNPVGGAIAFQPHRSSEHQDDSKSDPRLNKILSEYNWIIIERLTEKLSILYFRV